MIDIEQLRADIAAGTPGPWVNDGPTWNAIIWSDNGNRIAFMAHSNGLNDARDEANARRIARLPDLETAYLALAEEIARLRAALKPFADIGVGTDPDYQPQIRLDRDAILAARAALGETK